MKKAELSTVVQTGSLGFDAMTQGERAGECLLMMSIMFFDRWIKGLTLHQCYQRISLSKEPSTDPQTPRFLHVGDSRIDTAVCIVRD